MIFENILVQKTAALAQITINRPKKLNALNKATIFELHKAFDALESDLNIKVIILTGSGEKAFVAGADISEFAHFTTEEGATLAREGQEILFNFIENLATPVIAAINGFALGGGLELAMSCHIRVASDNARMGLPEVSLGVIPGYGGTQRLPRLVGRGKANEMIFTAGMTEWRRSHRDDGALIAGAQSRIERSMDVALSKEANYLQSSLGVLASIGSVAPFIGLFGTVWGIMNAFIEIAAQQNTNLAVVAPGIAEALLATGLGLLAAIPAVVFYNNLSAGSDRLIGSYEAFADEFSTILSRQLGG